MNLLNRGAISELVGCSLPHIDAIVVLLAIVVVDIASKDLEESTTLIENHHLVKLVASRNLDDGLHLRRNLWEFKSLLSTVGHYRAVEKSAALRKDVAAVGIFIVIDATAFLPSHQVSEGLIVAPLADLLDLLSRREVQFQSFVEISIDFYCMYLGASVGQYDHWVLIDRVVQGESINFTVLLHERLHCYFGRVLLLLISVAIEVLLESEEVLPLDGILDVDCTFRLSDSDGAIALDLVILRFIGETRLS